MKFIVILHILVGYSVGVFSQNLPYSTKENSQPVQENRWDLSKYIWSQTHCSVNKRHKQNVDFATIDNWTEIGNDGDLVISNDGKYFAYTIQNKSTKSRERLVVQSTSSSWRKEFSPSNKGFFSSDNKQFIYQDKDSLCFVPLGDGQCKYIKEVSSFRNINNGKWLAWQLKKENRINLLNLNTGREMQFDSISDIIVDPKGVSLVLKMINARLRYVNLENGLVKDIWTSTNKDVITSSYSFDTSGRQLVFLMQQQQKKSVWYYKTGMDSAVLKINNPTSIIQQAGFTDNGMYIILRFQQQQPDIAWLKPDAVNVEIWSYQDTILRSNQIYQSNESKSFLTLFNPENDQLIYLENRHEKLKAMNDEFAVVGKVGSKIHGDRFWEPNYQRDSNYLVSLKDGIRKLLKTSVTMSPGFWFSPQGNYLIYFDPEQQCNYFSYDLHTGKVVNISSRVPAWELGSKDFYEISNKKPNEPAGVIGWSQNGTWFMVYDNYDFWLLDVTGKKAPINITNGYGRSHQIKFDLEGRFEVSNTADAVFTDHQLLLLKAFDNKNKYNGFFRKQLGKTGDPYLLYMGPCIISGSIASVSGMKPLKANDVDVWIVRRQSITEAPNYFLTRDFKNYTPLTDIQPQKQYNWLRAELHRFKYLNGKMGQGILYKPENFNPAKKYPVLIVFYRDYANRLYEFRRPRYNWSAIAPGDSPIFLLNFGYLVFTPDINVYPLKYGPSAYNVVEGAAKYLQKLPYVDAKHIGGAAHSWSAKLGTYVFTHSHNLAAMAISEGFLYANLINMALSINEIGQSNLEAVENEFKFGNLWENKSSWLDQTEVLQVDKAACPLLLYCNKKSLMDYQNQTTQLFTALRRLSKPCWWLKYEKSSHTLEGDDARDYTLRYIQYFDHYLKGAPAPRWMTEGIPAAMEGIETGYELDPAGSCAIKGSMKCKVCEKWNFQYKKTPELFIKSVKE
jgi:dipeptidyl aminopeptidase/acylaminoacyl peptidase